MKALSTSIVLVVARLFVAVPPPSVDEAHAVADVERALHVAGKNGVAAVQQAIDGLVGFDSVSVAQVLVKAFGELEADAQSIEKQAHADIEAGKLSPGEIISRRATIDPIRKAQTSILDRVGHLRATDALVWLVDHLIGDDKIAVSVKLEAARNAAVIGAPMVDPLNRALQRSKNPDDLIASLAAIAVMGPTAKPMVGNVVPLVDHAEATVREHAALALARIGSPLGVEPLVRRIDKETGRTQLRIAAALEILTRQKFGLGVDAWKQWFAAEGIRYTSGQVELGGGESTVTAKPSGYFQGIPQDSHSIIYVIDVSGSMKVSMTNPKFEDSAETRPIPAPPGEMSRIESMKKELTKALNDLPDGAKFDIIYYSTKAERYAPHLLEASPAVIKKAQKFVDELKPDGATNIYDAMESAFGLAGRGSFDKYYDSGVDTIFLLTDGQPSIVSQKDSTTSILEAVRRMNPFKRVTVHTIGLGKGINVEFLKQMASENNGVFVQK